LTNNHQLYEFFNKVLRDEKKRGGKNEKTKLQFPQLTVDQLATLVILIKSHYRVLSQVVDPSEGFVELINKLWERGTDGNLVKYKKCKSPLPDWWVLASSVSKEKWASVAILTYNVADFVPLRTEVQGIFRPVLTTDRGVCLREYLFDFRRINIYFLFCRTNSVRDLIFV
jgi:hypothetical protein